MKNFFLIVLVIGLICAISCAKETSQPNPDQEWTELAPSNYPGSSSAVVVGKNIYSILGLNGVIRTQMEEYSTVTGKWTVKSSPSIQRYFFATAVMKEKIYLLGGVVGNSLTNTTNSVEMYDPLTAKWTQKASMNEGKFGSFAFVINDKIYAVGKDIIEEYDTTKNEWIIKYSGLMNREGAGITVLNNKIYIVGGKTPDASSALTDVEEYDPYTNKVTIKASLLSPVCFPYLGVYKNNIYLLWGTDEGGCAGTNSVQAYNPDNNIWETKSPFPCPRADIQVVFANEKFYLTGGWLNGKFVDNFEEYDPAQDKWTIRTPMPSPRNYHNAVSIDGKIYVFGGKSDVASNLTSTYVYVTKDN
jgi:N-acetylneuraminic acid mutarotase